MGWQQVALSSSLTSSCAPLSSEFGCCVPRCRAQRTPLNLMRCGEVSTMDESRNGVPARANGNGRIRLYLGREEGAAERVEQLHSSHSGSLPLSCPWPPVPRTAGPRRSPRLRPAPRTAKILKEGGGACCGGRRLASSGADTLEGRRGLHAMSRGNPRP
jgi:hypothetical protein